MAGPTSLIINSAFVEPKQHWAENTDRTLRREPKRRAAGYEIIDTRENTRRQVPIPLVDTIRERVRQWRAPISLRRPPSCWALYMRPVRRLGCVDWAHCWPVLGALLHSVWSIVDSLH